MERCRDNYVTIAQLEYRSTQVFDTDSSPAAAEAARNLDLPDYVQWEPASTALGNIEGLHQKGMGTPHGGRCGHAGDGQQFRAM